MARTYEDWLKGTFAKLFEHENPRYGECHKAHGNRCCRRSSCWTIAGQGCHAHRGATSCFGATPAPLRKGICMCKEGACDDHGVCSQDPLTWKMLSDLYTANGNSTAELADLAQEQSAPQQPQDDSQARRQPRTSSWITLVAPVALFSVAGIGLMVALRRRCQHNECLIDEDDEGLSTSRTDGPVVFD